MNRARHKKIGDLYDQVDQLMEKEKKITEILSDGLTDVSISINAGNIRVVKRDEHITNIAANVIVQALRAKTHEIRGMAMTVQDEIRRLESWSTESKTVIGNFKQSLVDKLNAYDSKEIPVNVVLSMVSDL